MSYAVQGAALAPITTAVVPAGHLRRLLIALIAIALAVTLIAIESPVATQAKGSEGSQAQRIVRIARSHLGARFQMGAEGPRRFDCSGFVYRVYKQAGLIRKVGGSRKLAASYYRWFKQRGLASRGNPRVGDLIWWTKRGRITHMGLYIGGGRAISALVNPHGVKTHGIRSIRVRFLAYGHVRL